MTKFTNNSFPKIFINIFLLEFSKVKRMKNKFILVLVLVIFLFAFVSATYKYKNYSIQENYALGSAISGTVKMSFKNEPVNRFFSDSFGNKVSLKSILEKNPTQLYSCSYNSCESKFEEADSATQYSFDLKKGESAFYAIVFDKNLVGINSISFNLESNAPESPTNQIAVDILNDGSEEIKNENSGTSSSSSTELGCFKDGVKTTEVNLETTQICQKITLKDSPGAQIGGWIREDQSGDLNVTASLFDKDGSKLSSCKIPKGSISSSSEGSRAFCEVNTPIKEGNYYVCLKKSASGSGKYVLRGYDQDSNCGFLGNPVKNPVYTYEIGAKEKYFGNVGTLLINKTLPTGESFSNKVENYLYSTYGSLDCSKTSCIVPIKINAYSNQTITLKNLDVSYAHSGGTSDSNLFSKLIEDPSLVNASLHDFSLGSFFKVPSEPGKTDFKLSYNGENLFTKRISVKDFNINVLPKKIPVGFSNEIYVYVPKELAPVSYFWDFGDGSNKTSSTETVTHAYASEGNYTLSLTILTNIGEISKSFVIEVSPASEVLFSELQKRKDDLDNFEASLSTLNIFEGTLVKDQINLSKLKTEISTLQDEESLAITDEDYNKIIQEFLGLKFPTSLQKYNSSNTFLNPSKTNVDLSALNEVTNKTYKEVEGTYNYIKFWNINNLNSALTEKKIIINWDDGSATPINVYLLSILPLKTINESYYLFVKDSNSLKFKENSKVKTSGNYKYIKLSGNREDFTFSNVDDSELSSNIFISPENVVVTNSPKVSEFKAKIWIIYLGVVVVLLIGFIIYLIMVHWYKVKYEKFLFPDRNQLYNAIVYITNLLKQGTNEKEIKENLLKAGWKREQVSYLLKKYAGKRTGMPDLFGFLKPKRNSQRSTPQRPPSPGGNIAFKSVDDEHNFNK